MAPNFFLGLFVAPLWVTVVCREKSGHAILLICTSSLLPVAAIHLHLPSPIPPPSLYATQPLSNSKPACFWKPMSVSLPNLESPVLFFAAQPWSLGAWGAAVGDTGLTLPTLTASN